MNVFVEWLASLPSPVQAALIGVLGTLVTAAVALFVLSKQLKGQAQQARESIAENERRKLKAVMYEEAVTTARTMSDAGIELTTKLRSMSMDVTIASTAASVGMGYNVPPARYPALSVLYGAFSDAALKMVFFIEARQFIDPRLLVFRTAIGTVLYDTRNLMYRDFPLHVMPALPTDNPNGGIFPYTPPPVEGAKAIEEMSDKFIASLDHGIHYADDFLVDLQNLLVGDLFKKPVKHRVPLDPKYKVVTIDHYDALEAWFATETEWGRERTRIEAEGTAQITAEQQAKEGDKDA